MSDTYSTDELVDEIIRHWFDADCNPYRDAIIARLCAADKLHEVAKVASESQGWDGNDPDEDRWKELYAKLRKAIADYEGEK
jgi:hypothetical protein